jgi:hypothetical protein
MTHDALSKVILDSAFRIHSALGPGLFEHVYEVILAYELRKQHLQVARQVSIPIVSGPERSGQTPDQSVIEILTEKQNNAHELLAFGIRCPFDPKLQALGGPTLGWRSVSGSAFDVLKVIRNRIRQLQQIRFACADARKMLIDSDDDLLEPRRLSGRCQNGVPPDAVGVDVLLLKDQHLDRDMDK